MYHAWCDYVVIECVSFTRKHTNIHAMQCKHTATRMGGLNLLSPNHISSPCLLPPCLQAEA